MGTQQSKDNLRRLPTVVVPDVDPIDGVAGLTARFEVAQAIYEHAAETERDSWRALNDARGDTLLQFDWLGAQERVRETHELRLALGRQLQAALEEAGQG